MDIKVKERKIIEQMEYKWRTFRILRKILHWMIKYRVKYTSPSVCYISRILSNYYVDLVELQQIYEKCTGRTIRYYKKYEIIGIVTLEPNSEPTYKYYTSTGKENKY